MASIPKLPHSLVRPGAYQKFVPEVGGSLVVYMPGETARCTVNKVISPDSVLVQISSVPMAKTHNFRLDDIIGVRRRLKNGRDIWEAQSDREFLAEQQRLIPSPSRKTPAKKPRKAKKELVS